MAEKLKGRVRLYACGGAGVNIGKQMERFRGNEEVGLAVLDIAYIDTSRSNLSAAVPDDAVYLLKDLDGSGKVRKENYQEITAHTREILQKHAEQDLNIVISSAAGGSGSVIAPSIVSELLERDVPVIVVLVGSTDTRLEIDNTLKTIKSYEAISKLRSKPVVVKYLQNSKITPRAQVDGEVLQFVTAALTIWSRENAELDSKDLFNFLNFQRVTTFPSQLAAINNYVEKLPEEHSGEVVSVVTLARSGEDSSLPFTPDYQAVGFLPEGVSERILNVAPIHMVVTTDLLVTVSKGLQTRLQELEQAQRARVATASILSDKDNTTDTGLVL